MTPLQLARAECANHKNNACTGMDIKPDGRLVRGTFGGPSCQLSNDRRCTCFETAVAPMAEYVTDPKKAKSYAEAVFAYRRRHPQMDLALKRTCPGCQETAIGGRDKYCPACLEKRRAQAQEKAQAGLARFKAATQTPKTSDLMPEIVATMTASENRDQIR